MPVAETAARSQGEQFRLLIAGGGTGGHLFPGLAIAEEFKRRLPQCEVRFAGSAYGIEATVIPARGYRLYRLPVRGLYRVPLRRKIWVVAMLPIALMKAAMVMLTYRPRLVIGVGGYASGPMLLMAVLLRTKTAIQEQNAVPGLTNRLLGRLVDRAFVPLPGMERHFPRHQVVGTPVRREILALREAPPRPRPVPLLFIFGGSQGARRLNEAMTAALPQLEAWDGALEILHQTGPLDIEWVERCYRECSIPHRVVPFVEDMAGALAGSRLVVSRAGASAVTEIITARRASLLIPIPGTSGEHQLMNARRVAEAGAGILLEQAALSGEVLAGRVIGLLEDPPTLDRMEERCDTLFQGDSAARIVESGLEMVGMGQDGWC